jgi:hypothetical protein
LSASVIAVVVVVKNFEMLTLNYSLSSSAIVSVFASFTETFFQFFIPQRKCF